MVYLCSTAFLIYLTIISFTNGLDPIAKYQSAYDGLIVAIHSSVPENETYIAVIKELIQNTSTALYKATNGLAYFRKVSIALPETWNTTKGATTVYENYFPSAHIRILPPLPGASQVTAPFTLQPGGCGEPGEFTEVRTDFLTADPSLLVELYGPKEKMMVREWTHLRFGAFDEYGIPGHSHFPLFYFNDGLMEVSTCPAGIKGWIWSSRTGEMCDVYEDSVASDCIFIPDTSDETIESSLMSITMLPRVDYFCNKTEGKRLHNWRAPTKQNLLCQGRDVWDVIAGHPDISKMGTKSEFQPAVFQVTRLEKQQPRHVLVLDVSGSMSGRPLEIMKQACSWFIKEQIPDGSYLGVVDFGTFATVQAKLDLINSTSRQRFINVIQGLGLRGTTSIGDGLQKAVQVLNTAKQPTAGARIVLLTDGGENQPPTIKESMKMLISAKVEVHTVALGAAASPKLENLATDTKGRSYFFPELTGASTGQLNQIFLETITVHGDVNVDRLELLNNPYKLTSNLTTINIVIDRELGKNTFFSVSSQNITDLQFSITSPNGVTYNWSRPEFEEDLKFTKSKMYNLPLADSGRWIITLNRTSNKEFPVDLSVVSEPRNPEEKPVRVKSWINATNVQYPNAPKVFAHVTKGNDAVLRANVQAIITSDQKRTIHLDLNDGGKGADAIADDGIYSAYFSDFKANEKRYTVIAEVKGSGNAFIKPTQRKALYMYASPPIRPKDPNGQKRGNASNTFTMDRFRKVDVDPDLDKQTGEPLEDFDRVTNAGSFIVEGTVVESKDLIKPSPIKDLTILSTERIPDPDRDLLTVSLRWTAPGDNMDIGKAESLDLRGGNSSLKRDELFILGYSFPNNESIVINGSLDTVEAGTLQFATVLLPVELQGEIGTPFDVQFSIRATDKSKNIGDMGNVVSAHFGYSISDGASGKEDPDDKKGPGDKEPSKSGNLTVIVAVTVSVGVVVLIVIISVIIYKKRKQTVV